MIFFAWYDEIKVLSLQFELKRNIMKKLFILLLILASTATAVFSQNMRFFYNGNELGDSLIINGINPETSDLEITVEIMNTTPDTMAITFEKQVISLLSGSYNSFCIGTCFNENVLVSPYPIVVAPGDTSAYADFHILYNPEGGEGVTIMRYIFTPRGGTSDTIIAKYSSEQVGIENNVCEVREFFAYPNPANDYVNVQYDLSNYRVGSECKIVITNLIGSKICAIPVNSGGGKTTIDVSMLVSGIYFYSLQVDNKIIATKKLVVK